MSKLYVFYDRVSGIYSNPIIMPESKPVVVRAIRTGLQQGGALPWQQYPADHQLYSSGEYDENTGLIVAYDKPEFILNLTDLLEV